MTPRALFEAAPRMGQRPCLPDSAVGCHDVGGVDDGRDTIGIDNHGSDNRKGVARR